MTRKSTVQPTSFSGWRQHPIYKCDPKVWSDVAGWMWANEVEHLQLSFSNSEVVFQVESHHDWFVMRWL